MKAYTWKLKLFLLVHKFSIEQSFRTPYFHIVFLTKMIWKKKDLKGRGPKQGCLNIWLSDTSQELVYHIISIAIKMFKTNHTLWLYSSIIN
jgi:hypothetical protein